MWSHSGCCSMCKKLKFFLIIPKRKLQWLTDLQMRTTTKKCYGLVASSLF